MDPKINSVGLKEHTISNITKSSPNKLIQGRSQPDTKQSLPKKP